MLKVLITLFEALTILMIVSQVIVPIFVRRLPLFWLFRSKSTKTAPDGLDTLADEVDDVVQKRDEVKEKVESVYSTAEKLRKKL